MIYRVTALPGQNRAHRTHKLTKRFMKIDRMDWLGHIGRRFDNDFTIAYCWQMNRDCIRLVSCGVSLLPWLTIPAPCRRVRARVCVPCVLINVRSSTEHTHAHESTHGTQAHSERGQFSNAYSISRKVIWINTRHLSHLASTKPSLWQRFRFLPVVVVNLLTHFIRRCVSAALSCLWHGIRVSPCSPSSCSGQTSRASRIIMKEIQHLAHWQH